MRNNVIRNLSSCAVAVIIGLSLASNTIHAADDQKKRKKICKAIAALEGLDPDNAKKENEEEGSLIKKAKEAYEKCMNDGT